MPLPTYLDSPEFLTLSLHLISIISTPIYLLGIYCILFKTPKPMESAKWYLLNVHISIIILDVTCSVLVIPYAMIPLPALFTCGLLEWLGVKLEVQVALTLVTFGCVVISNVSIYENRFYTLCEFRLKPKWKSLRWIWLQIHYIAVIFSYTAIGTFLVPEQETAKLWLFQKMTHFPSSYQTKNIIVMAYDYTYILGVSLPFSLIVCSEVFFFILFIVFNMLKQQKDRKISQKTFEMHRKFFIALVTQTTVPFLLLFVPLSGLVTIILSDYQNQALINTGIIILVVHGFVATVVMLLVHRPYRLAVKEMIRIRIRKRISMEVRTDKL